MKLAKLLPRAEIVMISVSAVLFVGCGKAPSTDGSAANAIQAGVTDTPALRKIPENEKMIELALQLNPGNRLTVPEDVAKTISLLGLSENSWLTGNTIRVDGGENITG